MIAIQFKNRIVGGLILLLCMLILNSSCNKDKLDIQMNFPFELNVMPVPKGVAKGKTVEIRMTIKSSGNYQGTEYFIRYFQFDGTGTLQYWNHTPYEPNDLYVLADKEFRLYYTSSSAVSHAFDIWVSDTFGNEKQMSFQFNNID